MNFSHQPHSQSYFVCPEWDSADTAVGAGKEGHRD